MAQSWLEAATAQLDGLSDQAFRSAGPWRQIDR
jgi:hypothetical protein